MSTVAEADKVKPDSEEEDHERTWKMARLGRKYAALFELAALAGSETPPEEWASRLLRLMSSGSWADPSFLEELSESGLVREMCRALPLLKANAANRPTAGSVQDLADLEESMRKLRHELAQAEKRLPSHGVLGSGGSACYTTWASVGHVCTLMLQALTYSVAPGQSPAAANARASPPPAADGSRAANGAASPAPAGGAPGDTAATPQPAGAEEVPDAQAADAASPAATPAAGGAGAAAATGGPSGESTPRGGAPVKPPGGGAAMSPGIGGSGSSVPAVATEGGLLKLLGNRHVVAHAKEVMRAVPEPYKATLARILLTQISTEMKATQTGLVHILQILQGDPAATSPVPSTLPKAWLTTAALLTAYGDTFRASLCLGAGAGAAGGDALALDAAAPAVAVSPAATAPAAGLSNGGQGNEASAVGAGTPSPSGTAPSGSGSAPEAAGADGDVEMADAPAGAAPETVGGERAAGPAEERPAGPPDESAPGSDAEGAAVGSSAPSTPPARKGAAGAKFDSAVGSPSAAAATAAATAAGGAPGGGAAAAAATDHPRVALVQLLQAVASALHEAVIGAHGVGRMALLLRGDAAVKFPNAAAYMPAALSINELMGHLDGLACVATALGASDSICGSVTSLLTSQAMKELLGAGKVYVTTVIAAGALTRDLAIDAVIPQSLRQGYMAAVLTPLETGALLNERRAPQVLAYRNSITESSYYQVMDVEALPYGINVRFEDEQEAEGMGVVREWLSQIAADIFSPERGLFVRGAADRRVVHPAAHSRLQEDYLGYKRFAGRIVGLALRANVPLGVVLSTGLFNYLTGRRATLQDLQQLDPQVFTTCQNILSSPGVEALELYHVWHGAAGSSGGGGGGSGGSGGGSSGGSGGEQEQELLPGGASLLVTDSNKAEYVRLLAHHVVISAVEEQCAAFLAGVQDTAHHLPEDGRLRRAFLTPLLLEDLNRIIAGESRLDPDDWANYTDVAGFEGPEEQGNLDMFWQLVSEYSLEDRQRLLQFWTAMTHLPSGGFKALNQRLQIMKLGPSATRPAGGEPTGDGPGAAAAAVMPAVNRHGHGPSADGTGPHSHRLDGDSLEGEEQEQSDGMEEPAEDAEPPGAPPPQQPQGGGAAAAAAARAGSPAAGGSGGGFRGADVGDAAPAAEADLSGAELASAVAAASAAAAGSSGAGGAAGAQAPSTAAGAAPGTEGAEGGDDADMPYEDEDEEAGAGEDGMDYGDDEEDEDAEFQRQLEMALALSLQDMPAEPAQGSRSGSDGGAGSAGGAGDGAGAAGGHEGPGEGAGGAAGQGALPAPNGAPLDTTPAAPLAAAEEAEPSGSAPQREEAGEPAGVAPPRSEDAGGISAGDDAAAAGPTRGSGSSEPAAAPQQEPERRGAEGSSPQAPVPDASGNGAAGGTAAAPPEAARSSGAGEGDTGDAVRCEAAAVSNARPEDAAAATSATDTAAGAVGEAGSSRVASRDSSGPSLPGAGADGAAAPQGPGIAGAADPMDTDGGGQGAASNQAGAHSTGGEAAGEEVGPALPAAAGPSDPSDAVTANRSDAQAEASSSGQQQWEDADQQQRQPHGEEHRQQQAQDGEGEQEQVRSGGQRRQPEQENSAAAQGAAEPMQEQEAQQSAAATAAAAPAAAAAAAANVDGAAAAGGAGGSAALAPSQSVSRALPLLPQARTCFLQLNLPVYGRIEDMRRAFAIALDNMSFGLH